MTARTPAILAIDVGTTSAKAGLVGLDGSILAIARRSYELSVSHRPGWAEQDPLGWWSALVSAARELVGVKGIDVAAIAVDGHGPSMTAVDAEGSPTRAAITWLDSRSRPELDELAAASGLRGWALGVLPAALWVERSEPAVAQRTRWYMNTWEYLGLRLTGRAATTVVPDQVLPDASLIEPLGLPPRKLAPRVQAAELLGGLSDSAAGELGLTAGTPVVSSQKIRRADTPLSLRQRPRRHNVDPNI